MRRQEQGVSRPAPLRANRKITGRRVSIFNVIVLLFVAGIAIVLYVNNILAVNQLAYEVNRLQIRVDSLTNVNTILLAQVNRKSGLEQIGRIATQELRLQYLPPGEQPVLLELDPEKLKRLSEE